MPINIIPHENHTGNVNAHTLTFQFDSILGPMCISTSLHGISKVEFLDEPLPLIPFIGKSTPPPYMETLKSTIDLNIPDSNIAQNLQNAIDLINGVKIDDTIRLCPVCSPFQFAVYRELIKVQSGQTATYSEIAKRIGRPTATRAVATAIARNPIAILIPCHRIVPAAGGIGNYYWGSDRKRALLDFERHSYMQPCTNDRTLCASYH